MLSAGPNMKILSTLLPGLLAPSVLLAAEGLVISEFLASNVDGLEDRDGRRSDWIELWNASSEELDLEGTT